MANTCCHTYSDHYKDFVDLAKTLSKDATLANVLQTLDEYYGIVMTFDALSKELYSLKQGSRENVAKFGVHLLQQVQILQSEYLGRIKKSMWRRWNEIASMMA